MVQFWKFLKIIHALNIIRVNIFITLHHRISVNSVWIHVLWLGTLQSMIVIVSEPRRSDRHSHKQLCIECLPYVSNSTYFSTHPKFNLLSSSNSVSKNVKCFFNFVIWMIKFNQGFAFCGSVLFARKFLFFCRKTIRLLIYIFIVINFISKCICRAKLWRIGKWRDGIQSIYIVTIIKHIICIWNLKQLLKCVVSFAEI